MPQPVHEIPETQPKEHAQALDAQGRRADLENFQACPVRAQHLAVFAKGDDALFNSAYQIGLGVKVQLQ